MKFMTILGHTHQHPELAAKDPFMWQSTHEVASLIFIDVLRRDTGSMLQMKYGHVRKIVMFEGSSSPDETRLDDDDDDDKPLDPVSNALSIG